MKRSPLNRRTPLARGSSSLKRTGFKPPSEESLKRSSAWRRTVKPEDPALRTAKRVVRARSGGRCEVRSRVCVGEAAAAHHVLRRPHMTRDHWHDPALMLDSCGPCHGYLHAHVEEAFERGWLIHALPLAPPPR